MANPLPGYRGPLHGPDAEIVRRELDALRYELLNSLVPKGVILHAKLSATEVSTYFTSTGAGKNGRWRGWAICNGQNGTPDLAGKFPRFSTSAAGGTGGTDSSAHTHAGAAHTHAVDHDHGSFVSGSAGDHEHTAGKLAAQISFDNLDTPSALWLGVREAEEWTPNWEMTDLTIGPREETMGITEVIVHGSTAMQDPHQHSVNPPAFTGTSGPASAGTTGAASATDNRPVYYELVPVMRIA